MWDGLGPRSGRCARSTSGANAAVARSWTVGQGWGEWLEAVAGPAGGRTPVFTACVRCATDFGLRAGGSAGGVEDGGGGGAWECEGLGAGPVEHVWGGRPAGRVARVQVVGREAWGRARRGNGHRVLPRAVGPLAGGRGSQGGGPFTPQSRGLVSGHNDRVVAATRPRRARRRHDRHQQREEQTRSRWSGSPGVPQSLHGANARCADKRCKTRLLPLAGDGAGGKGFPQLFLTLACSPVEARTWNPGWHRAFPVLRGACGVSTRTNGVTAQCSFKWREARRRTGGGTAPLPGAATGRSLRPSVLVWGTSL